MILDAGKDRIIVVNAMSKSRFVLEIEGSDEQRKCTLTRTTIHDPGANQKPWAHPAKSMAKEPS
jgi:hypothetical protein